MAPQADIVAEGVRIPPLRWIRAGVADPGVSALLFANMRDPAQRQADLAAQAGALRLGGRRLLELAGEQGGLAALARRRERTRADGVRMARECASDSIIGGKR